MLLLWLHCPLQCQPSGAFYGCQQTLLAQALSCSILSCLALSMCCILLCWSVLLYHLPKEDASFSDKHGGWSPAQQLAIDDPNVWLCHWCYHYSDDLQLAHLFSACNGFGPILEPPLPLHFAHELDCLLKQLTLAEEVAIHWITPMVSIVWMQY